MDGIVFVNDAYTPADEAKVSIFDRGYLFGDGVYEVVPIINASLVDKVNFLERLSNSLSVVGMQSPYTEKKILQILRELIHKNDVKEGGAYLQITRGVAPRDFAFPENTKPSCIAFTFHKSLINNSLSETGVQLVTVPDLRWKRRDVKSIALLAQCMSKEKAIGMGGDDGLMVEDGFVTEGTASTAYIVKNDRIITRPLSYSILPGIRRKGILKLAERDSIIIEERLFSVEEALEADEVFLSSATAFVLPVVAINKKTIGNGKPGKLTKSLRKLYIDMALAESKESKEVHHKIENISRTCDSEY